MYRSYFRFSRINDIGICLELVYLPVLPMANVPFFIIAQVYVIKLIPVQYQRMELYDITMAVTFSFQFRLWFLRISGIIIAL